MREATVRTALRGGTWALSGTFVGRLAHVGALFLAARELGSAGFGGMALALSTALLVTSVSALGLPVAAQKLVAEARDVDPVRQKRLIDTTLAVTALVGIVAMGGFFLSGTWIATQVLDQSDLAPVLAVAAVLVLLTPCVEVLAGLLAALERFKAVGIYRAAHGLTAGCFLGVVLLLAPSAVAALCAVAAAETLTCILGWVLLSASRGQGHTVWRDRAAMFAVVRSLLRVSLPAMLASVSLQPALWLGQVVLGRQPGGLEYVGTFAAAMRWHAIALFVPATMGSVLLPMLGRLGATGRQADARTLFVRYSGMTLAFSSLACLLIAVLAGPLMGLLGPEYVAGAGVLVVLAVAVVPTAMNNVLSQRALADGKLALWVWSDAALAATLAICAVTFVPVLQAVGLAWSYLLAYLATCVVLLPIAAAARREGAARSEGMGS